MRLFGRIVAALLLLSAPAFADTGDTFAYRGFLVDISAVRDASDLGDIETSVKHQLDIVADCGARPEVMQFFHAQRITLSPNAGDGGGQFNASEGVQIDAAPEPPQEPIVLHELLHAFHARILPDGFHNAQVVMFYGHAKEAGLYPADAFLLKNPGEFFAVTASLYLFGHVDRPPFTRASLKAKQPYYYNWLGRLFGVQK